MGKIKDLPILERPREKAFRYGVQRLSDQELIALLLRCGYKDKNVLSLATDLLTDFGGIRNLKNVPYEELKKYKGLNKTKAIELSAIFEIFNRINYQKEEDNEGIINAEYLYNKYKNIIVNELQEILVIVVMSKNKKIIFEKIIYKGTANMLVYSIKEIVKTVLENNGFYYYLIHNHPSEYNYPSPLDIKMTSSLLSLSEKIGIKLIDHIIISRSGYLSILKNIE